MSKITKLLRTPSAFFRDAIAKRRRTAALGNPNGGDTLNNGSKRSRTTEQASGNDIPPWFQPNAGPEMLRTLRQGKPVFLYIPWIAEHGDMLISKISATDSYLLTPLDFVKDIEDNETRRKVARYAREQPHMYRRMIVRRLVPLRNHVSGIIFTFDWAPVMRIIASVCEELEIPRILVPHESVFIDRDKYYWDSTTQASTPSADVILGWGSLQRDIFIERGYPAERFIAVGAPKFDSYANYQPMVSREQFCHFFGLDPLKKIILFASQPLDSQTDEVTARKSQRSAINDLVTCIQARNIQLLVRLPPSKHDILGKKLRNQLNATLGVAIDDSSCYLVPPEEALYHSDMVTSINSTMLFEGLLQGRPSFSMKYVEFEQIWEKAGIPAVGNYAELLVQVDTILSGSWQHSEEGMQWAASMFSNGSFDGKAAARIVTYLTELAQGKRKITLRRPAIDRLLTPQNSDGGIDVIGIASSDFASQNSQKYLLPLLNARRRVSGRAGMATLTALSSVDIFLQWGITPSNAKARQEEAARALGRPIAYIEDGFIRSVDIGLSGEPGLAIILDDTTAYYDATRPSRLQRLLETGPSLSTSQINRARAAISKIVKNKVSKYNHAPDLSLSIGTPGRKKILLVDQRFGDQSVASGLADESSYERMLHDALREYQDCDIIIKQHPDAIRGGKSSYYSNERIAFAKYAENLYLVNFDINPYSLLHIVDEVFVVTSGMGFEALMAGKIVHCYGAPFYAGWGATLDRLTIPGRTRKRSLEELFHFAYIECSRYFHPERNEVVEVEELVDYIVEKRNAFHLSSTDSSEPSKVITARSDGVALTEPNPV